MQDHVYNSFNPGDFHPPYQYGDKTKLAFENAIHNEVMKARTEVHKLRHTLSKADYNIMLDLAGTRTIEYVNFPTNNTHPIAANLHKIAYARCIEFSKNFNRSIDIGGTPTRTPPAHHICTKIGNSREEARYVVASIMKPGTHMDRIHTDARRTMCTQGAEFCAYPADYAYMINVYDIELSTIADIMQTHNTRVLDAWMFLPLILYDKGVTVDQTYYKCTIVERASKHLSRRSNGSIDKRVIFSLCDYSNAYDHSYDIWRDYATKSMINGHNSAINIEVIDSWGTFHCIRFTRTVDVGIPPLRCVPLGRVLDDYIIIPDILAYIQDGQCWREFMESGYIASPDPDNNARTTWDKHAPKFIRCAQTDHYNYDHRNTNVYRKQIVADRHFVEELRHHGNNAKKDAFTFEGMSAFANAKKNRIHYSQSGNNVIVHKGIDTTSNVYLRLVMNVFLQVAIDRYNRTQAIAEVFGKLQTQKDWWPRLKRSYLRLMDYLRDNICNDLQSTVVNEDQNFIGGLLFMKPIYFKDFFTSDAHDASYSALERPWRPLPRTKVINPYSAASRSRSSSSRSVSPAASTISALSSRSVASSISSAASAAPTPAPTPAPTVRPTAPPAPTATVINNGRSRYDTPAGANHRKGTTLAAILADPTQGGTYQVLKGQRVRHSDYVRPGVIHGDVIDVAGDGFCGRHTMEYYGIKNFSSVPKQFHAKGWYTQEVMVNIAWGNRYGLMLHREGTPVEYYPCPHRPNGQVLNVDLVGTNDNGHWQPIICECDHSMHINDDIGDYGSYAWKYPILYVNCANANLGDGAGQALSFRKRFQNYDAKVNKPLKRAVTFIQAPDPKHPKNQLAHLALAVAHNNTVDNDIKKSHIRFEEICREISDYANKHNLPVLMPLIGTALYGGHMCCLKKYVKRMTCQVRMQFFTKNSRTAFYQTPDCTHAGYKELYETHIPNYGWYDKTNDNTISKDYAKIVVTQEKEHMKHKFDDLHKFCLDHLEGIKVVKYVEYAAAPGRFASRYRNKHLPPGANFDEHYFRCHYAKGWSYPMTHVDANFGYSNVAEFIKRLMSLSGAGSHKYDVFLDDCPCDKNTIKDKVAVLAAIKHWFKIYIYKVMYDRDLRGMIDSILEEFTRQGRTGTMKIIHNDASNITSGEQYFAILARWHIDETGNVFTIKNAEALKEDARKTAQLKDDELALEQAMLRPEIVAITKEDARKTALSKDDELALEQAMLRPELAAMTVNPADTKNADDLLVDDDTEVAACLYHLVESVVNAPEPAAPKDSSGEPDVVDLSELPDVDAEPGRRKWSISSHISIASAVSNPDVQPTTDSTVNQPAAKAANKYEPLKYNAFTAQAEIDTANYNKQQKAGLSACKCKIAIDINARLTARVSKQVIKDCIKVLIRDDPVVAAYPEIKDRLKSIKPHDVDVNIEATVGVGGAGKTMAIVKTTCNKCAMLVTPYRLSQKAVNKESKKQPATDSKHKFASTFIAVLGTYSDTIRDIILDEVFAQDMRMVAIYQLLWPLARFLGTGDPKQIKAVDWDGKLIVPKLEQWGYTLQTRRNPPAVTRLFDKYIPGINTTSKISSAVKYVGDREYPNKGEFGPNDFIVVFTRVFRDFLRDILKHDKIFTAAEVHSQTLPKVHLCYSDLKNMPEEARPRYLYTAASRVSSELIVYGAAGDDDIRVTLEGSALERAFTNTETPLIDTIVFEEKPLESGMMHETNIRIKPPLVPIEAVESVLNRIFIQANDLPPDVVDINPTMIPQIVSKKKFHADIRYFESYDRIVHAKKLSENNIYNRLYTNASLKKSVTTQLGRYAKKAATILTDKYTDHMFKGLTSWFKKGWEKIASANRPTPEKVMAKMTESLIVLQSKFPMVARDSFTTEELSYFNGYHSKGKIGEDGLDRNFHDVNLIDGIINGDEKLPDKFTGYMDRRVHILKRVLQLLLEKDFNPNKFADMETEFNTDFEYHKLVKFHMKSQPKEIRSVGFDAENKDGQGISAWTKMMNMVSAGFIRCYDELLPKLILPNVQLSYNASDSDLSTFWCQHGKALNNRQFIKFQNDFSQFDASNEERGIKAVSLMYRVCGISPGAASLMLAMGARWKMVLVHSPFGATSLPPIRSILEGEWQQHSGMIHTLGRNTTYNMAAMGCCFVIRDLVAAGFKGDDSLIICGAIEIRMDSGMSMIERLKYSFKMVQSDIPEYIANIVAPWGFIPDLIRRVSRVLSRLYKKREDWDEIKLSTADSLMVINESNLGISMMYLSKFYQNNGMVITEEELTAIYFFLINLVKSDTSVLGNSKDFQFLERFSNMAN